MSSNWGVDENQLHPSFKLSSIHSAKTGQGADCGSDHEHLIAQFRCKLKKVGKTTRSFRYDLDQIPYDYTVEVRNRFKGLDLIDRMPDLRTEVHVLYRRQGSRPSPRKTLQYCRVISLQIYFFKKDKNGCLRRPYK